MFPGGPALADALDEKRQPKVPYHVAADGALDNLAPDRYTVVAFDPSRRSCATATVDLREGEQKEIALRLDDGSCR